MDPKKFFNIDFTAKVKQYPYRKAVVQSAQIVLDRRLPEVRAFEEELAKMASTGTDNHTCYAIQTHGSDTPLYVMCSDFKMSIGTKIVEGSW